MTSTEGKREPSEPVVERLRGLKRQEIAACLIAERVLGAVAQAWDVNGRLGAVDAILTLVDGRTAAFEITNLAADGALETASLLARDDHRWPAPGRWWWTIEIGSPHDIRRLKQSYESIILTCEAAGITDPCRLGWSPTASSELQWLVQHSSSSMLGYPAIPAASMKTPGVMVVPSMGGGAVDDTLRGFSQALKVAFDEAPHIASHFEKLTKSTADERHLFIPLRDSALPFPLSSVLMFDDNLPVEPPPLPGSISHLWLAPSFSRRILLWCQADGWQNVYPYDN